MNINNVYEDRKAWDSIIFLSDFEPDDILAVTLLANIFKSKNLQCFNNLKHLESLEDLYSKSLMETIPILIVEGEGNKKKEKLANIIFEKMGFNLFHTYCGDRSNKDYPDAIFDAYNICSENRDCTLDCKLDYKSDITKTIDALKSFIREYDNPLIINLKPIRELKDIPKELTMKCDMIMYGSFNFRASLSHFKLDELADYINTNFKSVVLYESHFATHSLNNINESNAPNIFNKIINIYPELNSAIFAWNEHIVNEKLNEMKKYVDEILGYMNNVNIDDPDNNMNNNILQKKMIKYNRVHKIVNNIFEGNFKQLVLADYALIAFLFSNSIGTIEKGSVQFDLNGFTQFEQNNNGKIYMIKDVNVDCLIKNIEILME